MGMPNVGDRVLGQWEPEWFYPGVVVEATGEGFVVQFDDGDRATLNPDQVRSLSIQVGERVYGRWQGGGQYYPGRVSGVNGNAINIDYDDGDKEGTTISMVRINRADLD